VAVADLDARVVDRLGEAKLEDLRLQAALEEILRGEKARRRSAGELTSSTEEHARRRRERGTSASASC